MSSIKVVVHGSQGRMGKEVINALCKDEELEPVGAVDKAVAQDQLTLPDGSGKIPLSSDLAQMIEKCTPDIMVDFSTHEASMSAIRVCVARGVGMVIGTTGFSQSDIEEIEQSCLQNRIGAVIAANFSLGAVLMMHLSKLAAKYFDYSEIIELHHEQKLDSPSGTAISTAKELVNARGKPFEHVRSQKEVLENCRGGDYQGISIHSVRMPGFLAHQEVIFGGLGQTLTIRHDAISRDSFMPGVILAIKKAVKSDKLVVGLEALLGL